MKDRELAMEREEMGGGGWVGILDVLGKGIVLVCKKERYGH